MMVELSNGPKAAPEQRDARKREKRRAKRKRKLDADFQQRIAALV